MSNLMKSFLVGMLVLFGKGASAQMPRDTPQHQGISPARLEKLDKRYQAGVAAGEIPGAVVLLARNGKIVYEKSFGYADKPGSVAMTNDTVFALASMSKPVTTVAAMTLVEDGLIALDEPVSRYLPELKSLMVLTDHTDSAGKVTTTLEPPDHEPTIQDLMRHTSGFVYGQFGNGPVHQAYMKGNVWSVSLDVPLEETITRLSKIPLAHQPGTTFEYSISTDVLGRVIEVVSGEPLDQYVAEHVTGPLGLHSLKFQVDPNAPFAYDPIFDPSSESGAPKVTPLREAFATRIHKRPIGLSGGGGMYGTAGDYVRFAQMLMNGGQLDGVRILSQKSVMLMTSDQLGPDTQIPLNIRRLLRLITPSAEMGQGFGLGFCVRTVAGRNPEPGSVGEFYWAGASGVYFWVDPEQKLIALSMTAQSKFETKVLYRELSRQLVYQALDVVYPAGVSPILPTHHVSGQRVSPGVRHTGTSSGVTP
jgi:CubicO group peptidase (beta-lactamase class C family)